LSADWKELSRKANLKVQGGEILVACDHGRHQRVNVDDSDPEVIRLWSLVVTRGNADQISNAALQVWSMNRFRELVGFKIAEYGRVIGECWIPMIGISAREWRTYVYTLARSCDRLEYLWTGRDIE
jgi:hypothetical protein